MRKMAWKIRAPLKWCINCNIPLLTPKCEGCGEIGRKIKASPPLDLRPAFEKDLERIWKAITEEFGDWKLTYKLVPKDKVTLLNKVTHVDQADEVILDGWRIGQIYYDLREWKWRFKPLAEGCSRLIEMRRGYWAIIGKSRVKLWEKIPLTEIVKGDLPEEDGRFIAIGNVEERSIGIGVYENEMIKIIKTWKPQRTHIIRRRSSIEEAVNGNLEELERMEKRGKTFIQKLKSKIGKPMVISYSGGKDSLATLLLTLEAQSTETILFNNTGLEMPETIKNVENVKEKYGLNLIIADADENFWQSFEIFGPPARDYRWCCKTCKLIPISKTVREKFPEGSINLVGQRKYESIARSRSPAVWSNKWIPNTVSASPIMDWSALHVWLYLTWRKAPVNPLYYAGFDRIGCWLCPSCELAEFKLVEELHPQLWEKWMGKLKRWAERRGYSEGWVKYGFWRWIKIPGDQLKLARKMGVEIKLKVKEINRIPTRILKVKGYSPCKDEYALEAIIDSRIKLEKVKSILNILGEVNFSEELQTIILNCEKAKVNINSQGRITILAENEKIGEKVLKETVKTILRGMYCVKCGSCLNVCPTDAIKIKEDGIAIIEEKCVKCGRCQETCPITEYAAKILMKQL